MAETQPAWSRRWPQLFKRAVVGGAVTLVMVLLWIGTAHDGPLDTPAPFRVPQRSAEILMAGSTGGNVFCSVRHGGYLAWKLAPRFKPYIDGRLVLRTRAQFAEYLGVVDQPERFDALAKRHAFAAVVLPTAFPERYLGLLSYLAGHPNWRLAYTDGSEALFLPADEPRTAGPKIATMLHEIEQRYRDEPRRAALHNLARMLLVLQRPAEVRHVLAGLEDPTAQMLRAHSWYLERDLDQAERVAVRALAANAADLNSLNLLAAVAIDRGDLALALSYLGRVLHLDPYNTRGKSLLASIEARRAR